MKKSLSLVFAFLMVFAFTTISLADTTLGGDIRVWCRVPNNADPSFAFDRLTVNLNMDIDANSGIQSEIWLIPAGTTVFDQAYYYQKSIFTNNDEINVGYIDEPFFNEAYISINQNLARLVWPGPAVGVKYHFVNDIIEAIASVTNQRNYSNTNGTLDGFDYAIRGILTPVDGLKLGASFLTDTVSKTTGTTKIDLDATYKKGAFGVLGEFISLNPNVGNSESGTYYEVSYQVTNPLTIYMDGTVGADELNIYDGRSDYTLFGLKYQLTEKTNLQGEYKLINNSLENGLFYCRFMANF